MDPHAFFRRAEGGFYTYEISQNNSAFQPKPCDFIILKHMENSKIVVEQGTMSDEIEIRSFVDKERDPSVNQMIKIIFSPARLPTDHLNYHRLHTALPFEKNVFEYISNRFHFHKSPFETRRHNDARKIVCGSITSFFLSCCGDPNGNNLMIFVSTNDQTHITTIFAHGGLQHELSYIRERLLETALLPFTIHPLTFLLFDVESLVATEVYKAESYYTQAILRIAPTTMSVGDGHFVDESKAALSLQHQCAYLFARLEIITTILETMIIWSQEHKLGSSPAVHEIAFNEAEAIIYHRLRDLQCSVNSSECLLRAVKAYNEVHRQSLEVKIADMGNQLNLRLASQSRDIALDSRRDSSAMKAIAVLTMFFLPGTFVSACFAMPLFDWDAPAASAVVNVRFWIYVVITIPVTVIVLVSWRLWYQFGEWKQWQDRSGNGPSSARAFVKEFREWLRTGRPTRAQKVEADIQRE